MSDIYEFQFDEIPEIDTINNFDPSVMINKYVHRKISNVILNQDNNVDKVIDRLEKIIKYKETEDFLHIMVSGKETKWHKVGTLHLNL